MKLKQKSSVVSTRVLPEGELENLMNSIGVYLANQGFSPKTHTNRLLEYQAALPGRRGVYIGLFAPIGGLAPGVAVPVGGKEPKVVIAHVEVTDLPVSFCLEEGSWFDVTVGHAFGISAPAPVYPALVSMVAPYAADLDTLRDNAGKYFEGKTVNKKVPGIECDHCGYVQEVTIPITISNIEGNMGYGPGGSVAVLCSNPACNKEFIVSWENLVVEIDMK